MSMTNPERMKLTLKQHILKCAQLEHKLHDMCIGLQNSSMEIDNELSKDFITIFENEQSRKTPFMKLFWQDPQKLFLKSPTSPSCYEKLRNSGIPVLPSQRRLKNYRYAIKPKRGFQNEVFEILEAVYMEFHYARHDKISLRCPLDVLLAFTCAN